MLIEIKVEGGITRFCALFTILTGYSARDLPRAQRAVTSFQLILPLQPLYVHIGESVVQTQYV